MSSLPPPPSYALEEKALKDKSYVQVEYIPGQLFQLSSLSNPTDNTRTPIDMYVLIDVSASMGSKVNGVLESQNYMRLDLVKHAIRIIAKNLSGDDFITLVTFSAQAQVVLPRRNVTPISMLEIERTIEDLDPSGNTNMYDALKVTFEYIEANPIKQRDEQFLNRHMILLTDGKPTVDLPIGRTYSDLIASSRVKCRNPLLHTFGITKDELDDTLLASLAQQGQGMYGFISDPTIIAPCFINVLGVLFNMMYTGLTLKLTRDDTLDISVPWILQDKTVEIGLPAAFKPQSQEGYQLVLYSNKGIKMRTVQKMCKEANGEQKVQYTDSASDQFAVRRRISSCLLDIAQVHQHQVESQIKHVVQDLVVLRKTLNRSDWLDALMYDVTCYERIKKDSIKDWGLQCIKSLAVSLRDDFITNGYEKSYKVKAGPGLQYWLNQIEQVAKNIASPNPSYREYIGSSASSSYASSGSASQANSYYPGPPPRDYFSSSSSRDYDDGCVGADCLC